MDKAFIVFSAFSAAMSASVLLTGIVFVEMRKRLFMKIIMYIALSAGLASVASAFGLVHDESVLCPIQAFVSSWLYSASWMWTTALSFHLYSIVFYGCFILPDWAIHLICWIVPLILTLIPLSETVYGRGDDDATLGWCTIVKGGPVMEFISFPLTLFVCLLVTIILFVRIYWRYRSMDIKNSYPELYAILQSMALYPAGFFVTWAPNLLFALLINFHEIHESPNNLQQTFNIIAIWATQSGTVLAITFFWKSEEARMRWKQLLFGIQMKEASKSNDCNLDEIERATAAVVDEAVYYRGTAFGRSTDAEGRSLGGASASIVTRPTVDTTHRHSSLTGTMLPGHSSLEDNTMFGIAADALSPTTVGNWSSYLSSGGLSEEGIVNPLNPDL